MFTISTVSTVTTRHIMYILVAIVVGRFSCFITDSEFPPVFIDSSLSKI